jgi:hypothetical protein
MPNARMNLKLILAINRTNADCGDEINVVLGASYDDSSR